MPLYEYECEVCGKRFEVIQRFSDPAPDACRSCGKGPMRRLASSPAIQFKGSGFYITDYAKKSTPEPTGDTSKSDGSKADGKGETGKSQAAKGEPGKSESGKKESSTGSGATTDSGKSDHSAAPASKGESASKSDTKTDASSSAKPPSTGS